jgi:prepilin-type processing-associated H-X9-DG protein
VAQANSVAQFGVHWQIMPYVKNQQVFQCPNDGGFNGGTPTAGGFNVPAGTKIWGAYGTSYKFTKENFSMFPSSTPSGAAFMNNPTKYNRTSSSNGLLGAPGGPYTQEPPFPMPISFFGKPAQQRVMRCFVAPWESVGSGDPNYFHRGGNVVAFADGHVKFLASQQSFNTLCDGPTWSPVRNPGHPNFNANGDGSCNSDGLERRNN